MHPYETVNNKAMNKNLFYLFFLLGLQLMAFAQDDSPASGMTGEWGGRRKELHEKGIDLKCILDLDTTWNLDGGRKHTRGGDVEYLLQLSLQVKSEPLFHYCGGTFYVEFDSHHGLSPTNDVGSFNQVDYIEAPPFDELYAIWYKQAFGQKAWVLVGKSDAYENFTKTAHSDPFLNAGYSEIPTILFFPTYPDPAMSLIGFYAFTKIMSLKVGLFDGSLANGVDTGKRGVFGKFFDNLPSHAFLIGELDFEWSWKTAYKGRLGIGFWVHTAEFITFGGGRKRGASGPYLTFDQVIYKSAKEEIGLFFLYGSANPSVSTIQQYVAGGFTWQGMLKCRPQDILGVAASYAFFSQDGGAGFTDPYEAFYEFFYQWYFRPWGYLEPDYQYVLNPGGRGLPNASVLTLRLQVIF